MARFSTAAITTVHDTRAVAPGAPAGGGGAPAGGAPPGGAGGGATTTTTAASSAKAATSAEPQYYVVSVLLIVLGVVGGVLLQQHYHPHLTKLPVLAAGLSPFALLYVFAQSIERLLEPISPLLGGVLTGGQRKGELVQQRDAAWAVAVQTKAAPDAQVAASTQDAVDQFRANSAALSLGLASFLAMLASGYFGVFFLRLLGVTSGSVWLDLLVTGLAIGGGTKPLHDLISGIQSSSNAKKDPSEAS